MTSKERKKLVSKLLKSKKIKDIYETYIIKEIPFETWIKDTANRLFLGGSMNLLNKRTGKVHAIAHFHIGTEKGPLLAEKQYYVTKCHWSDDSTYWGKFQLGEETEKPVTCKNCLKKG